MSAKTSVVFWSALARRLPLIIYKRLKEKGVERYWFSDDRKNGANRRGTQDDMTLPSWHIHTRRRTKHTSAALTDPVKAAAMRTKVVESFIVSYRVRCRRW